MKKTIIDTSTIGDLIELDYNYFKSNNYDTQNYKLLELASVGIDPL